MVDSNGGQQCDGTGCRNDGNTQPVLDVQKQG